jgi:hypothetical protein
MSTPLTLRNATGAASYMVEISFKRPEKTLVWTGPAEVRAGRTVVSCDQRNHRPQEAETTLSFETHAGARSCGLFCHLEGHWARKELERYCEQETVPDCRPFSSGLRSSKQECKGNGLIGVNLFLNILSKKGPG